MNEYYLKNKEKEKARIKAYQKATNYASEKTPQARLIRNIKRKTRTYFPLAGNNCEFCSNPAKEHHHNTNPIEFDKFNFVCHACHVSIHEQLQRRAK